MLIDHTEWHRIKLEISNRLVALDYPRFFVIARRDNAYRFLGHQRHRIYWVEIDFASRLSGESDRMIAMLDMLQLFPKQDRVSIKFRH